MTRFAPIAVVIGLLAGACGGSSDPAAVPTLRLTTTTAEPTTTEAPTTTAAPTTTTAEPTTTVVAQGFDPETAQVEIAQLIEDFAEFWTFDNETPDPDDPRLEELFTGFQLDANRDLFMEIADQEQTVDGSTELSPYFPALLTQSNQTATLAVCRHGKVALLDPDGTVVIGPNPEPLEWFFNFRFVEGVWKVEAAGSSSGREIPCGL